MPKQSVKILVFPLLFFFLFPSPHPSFSPFLPSSMLQPRNLKESYHHISPLSEKGHFLCLQWCHRSERQDQAPLLPFLSLSSLCLVIPKQGHGRLWQRWEPFGQRLKVVSGNQKVPGRHGEEGTGQRNPNIHPSNCICMDLILISTSKL